MDSAGLPYQYRTAHSCGEFGFSSTRYAWSGTCPLGTARTSIPHFERMLAVIGTERGDQTAIKQPPSSDRSTPPSSTRGAAVTDPTQSRHISHPFRESELAFFLAR